MRPAPAAVVQARMSSSRLPGKVLAEIGGRPALALLLSRLRRCRELGPIAVATSVGADDDPVAELAAREGARVVRGSLDDVLGRYAQAIADLRTAGVVRITADCPVIDPEVVDAIVRRWRTGSEDYVANVIPPRTFPIGMDTEVVSARALLAAAAEATERYDREHVTPFVRSRPERFPAVAVRSAPIHPDLRLVIDTPGDLRRLRAIVAAVGPEAPLAALVSAADAA
jgi:spore coat polysaccharide biosynthesis protein SpsF